MSEKAKQVYSSTVVNTVCFYGAQGEVAQGQDLPIISIPVYILNYGSEHRGKGNHRVFLELFSELLGR